MFECRICSNSDNNRVHSAREMMFGTRDRFDYVECGRCSTLQILEVPDLSRYYPDNYLSFDSEVPVAKNLGRRAAAKLAGEFFRSGKSVLGKLIAEGVPRLAEHFPPSMRGYPLGLRRDSRILDFGCGNGRLLRSLHYFGFTNLTGADAFIKNDILYPTGVKIYRRRLDEFDETFDLVMLHHSFEHLEDPLNALIQIRRLLGNDGACLIRIPVVNFAWEKYGVNWVQMDAPRHLYLYTEGAFRSLAEKAGLSIEKVTYDSGAFQFWGSEQYARDIPLVDDRSYWINPGTTLFSSEQITKWQKQAEELNADGKGDMACFYLRPA
ncbi:MAG: class I SAM-dependent methyltransferase [Pyrinomonadaceae bacterium]